MTRPLPKIAYWLRLYLHWMVIFFHPFRLQVLLRSEVPGPRALATDAVEMIFLGPSGEHHSTRTIHRSRRPDRVAVGHGRQIYFYDFHHAESYTRFIYHQDMKAFSSHE